LPGVNLDAAESQIVRISITPDGRLRRRDAAAYLALSERTLANWHSRRIGPRSHRIGGRAFYYVADLEAFVASQAVH
jgi:hypothetical protein